MERRRVYLDYNASSPMRPSVAEAVRSSLGCGNPSSVHAEGRRARARLEEARERVTALVGAAMHDLVFTAGGTEANNAVLRPGAVLTPGGRPVARLIVGATEHPSVLSGHGFDPAALAVASVESDGLVDIGHVESLLALSDEPALLSIQVANSETGVMQDIPALSGLARRHGAAVHVDAVQAAGRVPLDLGTLGVDALTISAHKLGGPMGVGALAFAPRRAGPSAALIGGGGQERGLRAGTENVPGIVGFGIAAEEAGRDIDGEARRLSSLRDAAAAIIRELAPGAIVFGEAARRLPNTVAFAVQGVAAETALIALDLGGVAVSSGSACSSGKVGRSHVLAAMGVPAETAAGALRLSFGWNSTQDDVNRFAAAFASVLQRLYERGRAKAA